MFDGTLRLPMRRRAPPRPAPLDTLALLPLLRVQAAEAVLEHLALNAGTNVDCVKQWVIDNWGADADLRDPGHPYHVAALDESSPPFKLAETLVALADACRRYRAATGRDGLPFARQVIADVHGVAVAEHLIESMQRGCAVWDEVDDVLYADGPTPLPEAPEPTPGQRQEAARARAAHVLSYPELGDLQMHLERLAAACAAEGGDPQAPRVAAALAAVRASIEAALHRAAEADREAVAQMAQIALDTWAEVTGVAVRIEITG